MRLTKYSHACVRLEKDGVLVIDPGVFSEPAALDGVDAVLLTHEHVDHLNLDALTEALSGRPEVRIFTHPDGARQWLVGLARAAPWNAFIGRHWVAIASAIFVILVATQMYGAITEHLKAPRAVLLTWPMVVA